MSVRNIAIRLQAEGGAEIKRVLQEAGTAGKAAFDDVGAAADRAGAATDRLTQKNKDAANAAREAQNAATGAANAGGGSSNAGRPSGGAPSGGESAPSRSPSAPPPTDATRRETEALRRRLDEDYRNQRQRDRDEDIIRRGGTSGTFDEAEQARLRYLSQKKYAVNDNKPEGLNTYDRLFVKYQATDFAQQVIAGQSPVTALAQQGGQLYQQLADREGGLGAGLKQLGVSAAGLVTPFTVAGTAVLAAAGVFAYGAYQVSRDQTVLEKATQGLGRSTGLSASQLDDLAQKNKDAGKVSTSTAREIAAGYASTGSIAVPIFDTLISKTSEYARITGQDVPAATAELARMFADPAKGADDLANKLGGLDDKTRQLIATQAEQGDKTAAQTTLAEALKAAIDANAGSTSRWAQAWNVAASAADTYWEAAKRAVSVRLQQYGLGDGPSATQAEVDRLNKEIELKNRTRAGLGQEPLGIGSDLIRRRDTAALIVDTARREAEAAAAEDRASKASRTAGDIARSADPNYARLSELRRQASDLSEALADPLARKKLADFDQTETAYLGVTRAIGTLTDANGKLISSEEMVRRQDQLRLDAVKAKTEAEKADVAQRQKAFDLIGKAVTGSDARGQIERAGILARAEEQGKGGKDKAERDDEYDRALKQTDDRIRRQGEEAQTYGQTADVVARYRTETELLAAAKRAERDITPEVTAEISAYADRAAEAAKRVEDLREASRFKDQVTNIETEGVRSFVRDLRQGKSAADALASSLDRIVDRLIDLSLDSLLKPSKGGGGLSGLFSSLFGGESSSGGIGSIASFLGFDGGGYTGPGGVLQAAGIVHKGEVVWSQADVARYGGPHVVDAMRRGGRGYSEGGYVSPFTMPSRAALGSVAANGNYSVVINEAPGGDRAETRMERGPNGDPRLVVDLISRQQAGEMASGRGPFAAAVPGARRLRG